MTPDKQKYLDAFKNRLKSVTLELKRGEVIALVNGYTGCPVSQARIFGVAKYKKVTLFANDKWEFHGVMGYYANTVTLHHLISKGYIIELKLAHFDVFKDVGYIPHALDEAQKTPASVVHSRG
jgi:hypothetical protein